MKFDLIPANRASAAKSIFAGALVAMLAFAAAPAFCADGAPKADPPGDNNQTGYPDPLVGFNEAMFKFNIKLHDWVLHPVASGYAAITPQPVRESVNRFFDNVEVIPRFANNLFQLKLIEAGGEVARFGINSTLGVAGFFDPADKWFGLKEHPNDFGMTLRYYTAPSGPYLMLPFFGPSTIGDTIGLAADGAMNPVSYVVPWWITIASDAGYQVADAVNYRSLHLDQFEEADRYAIDLYGAVQDAYMQKRDHDLKTLREEKW
ncbi:MAG TPA: VacJ family lipoprotein [Candidatus Binataceae bacterium]|nr:VacJ family lipoprotein [Candidatus Binataceae bacterium]